MNDKNSSLTEALTEPNTINDSKPINNTREMYRACMDTGNWIQKLMRIWSIIIKNSYQRGDWNFGIGTVDQTFEFSR